MYVKYTLVLSAIIRANGKYFTAGFRFHKILEYNEGFKYCFCLLVRKEESTHKSSCIIDERHEISVSSDRLHLNRPACIRVNQCALLCMFVVDRWEWRTMNLPQCAFYTNIRFLSILLRVA